ncbi:MAG: phage tail tube protein [Gammaproteobacteria bacterium]|nr:phage tail tube protein [Gammaproteobacteria bacterium]
MGNRIAGTCYLKVDGEQLELSGSITCSMSGAEKEGLSGLSGVAGYKETPRVPFIEVEAYVPANFPVSTLEGMDDGTVTAELANGKTAVLSGAWLAGTVDVNGAEGTTSLKFEGLDGKWI